MAKSKEENRGRPTDFTIEITKEICLRITEGESLRQICRDPKMPARRTIHYWLIEGVEDNSPKEKKEFLHQYEIATDIRTENMFDEILDIADDSSNDWMEVEQQNGHIKEIPDKENIQRSRLRTDVRKWKLAKMRPKKYGEFSNVEIEIRNPKLKAIEDITSQALLALKKVNGNDTK